MSKTKATGATKLGRDSQPKYLGIKINSGEKANIGNIVIRQRGTKFLPGKNIKKGKDDTLYAMKQGIVRFAMKKKRGFNSAQRIAKIVHIDLISEKTAS
ncbi:MAG: 50S ribosomal protein L27 [Candidatus Nealsonbacteria bacterium CG_4_8_14_3_um_filter_39_7]|uniref:Large ribosomal subunit protein bL27 n=1 Tax=Candidatus Nealsonbacteria bacterium CG23_combo_of_CG06-09_8_20_14_all_39_17 TaxID=1974722 RepID=A0A2G9YUG9_9BACT|nr:MAG: 50S ribosomal protein L27 [Candidatus Nealsonbacteria bacterium CG23_combo_of_CG06-09_8_20_14_all_39_17]PIU44100.1 MAG: 50S ribosomal protein L27 [Candidatus Nealsonbacteria bacterium CG07_land_8_20_14_0_80_39_13]PIW90920.1 MAG: 50S ribosomal protein L27 [Candidatus Nealsonbacteria bacterium CG_4_8_14_3_um_filter_39_7]